MRTRSGSGGFNVAVRAVPVRAPNSGIMAHVPRGFSPRGAIDSMRTASASPFPAPVTMIGPFCGFTNGIVSVALGRSDSVWITPPKASRVSTVTRSPGWISRTGVEYGPIVKWDVPWRSSVSSWVVPS